MSWDRPWEPSPQVRRREQDDEHRRHEQLDVELGNLTLDLHELKERASTEAEKVAAIRELLERKRTLLAEMTRMQRERTEAEKATRAAERRLEFERRRSERLGQRKEGPRSGRPVRIEVDDGAWEVLRCEAISRRWSLMGWVGELVDSEAEAVEEGRISGSPQSRRRRSPGEAEPATRLRFLRVRVGEAVWTAHRLMATKLGLSAARYLGEIAEAEAHRLGWRAS